MSIQVLNGSDNLPSTSSACASYSINSNSNTTLGWSPLNSSSSQKSNLPTIVIYNRFYLIRRLGGGAFGEVFEAFDSQLRDQVAIKLEVIKTAHHPHLHHEARLYTFLNSKSIITVGIPKVRWFGQEGDYMVLVMDFLGPSIEELFSYSDRSFPLKTTYMIVEQIIDRIEFLHSMYYLHRDIKPDNFVMGTGTRAHHVYMIDLGLSKRYWNERAGEHITMMEGKQLTGTARYASLNTHKGLQQSRRDDMESIAYLAIYLGNGQLPWQGIKCDNKDNKYNIIMTMKRDTDCAKICEGLPSCFLEYLLYCRNIQFEEAPDYDKCRSMFARAMAEDGDVSDYRYSWLTAKRNLLVSDSLAELDGTDY